MAKFAFFSQLLVYPFDNGGTLQMNAQVAVCVVDHNNVVQKDASNVLTQNYTLYNISYLTTLTTMKSQFLQACRDGYGDNSILPVWLIGGGL